MLNPANLQYSDLVESPASDLLCKFLVGSLDILRTLSSSLDIGREPLVLEYLCSTKNGESRAVASLHGRNERKLLTNSERIFQGLGIILRIVRVCGSWCSENWSEKWAGVSKSLSYSVWESDDVSSISAEEVLDASAEGTWSWDKYNIVFLRGAKGIIVEVIDDDRVAIGWKVNVELEEEGNERRWGWG